MSELGLLIEDATPFMAVVLDQSYSDERLAELVAIPYVRAFEVRADLMLTNGEEPHAEMCRLGAFPVLFTLRHEDEGGEWHKSDKERLEYYESVLPTVQAIDVELEHDALIRELLPTAHEAGVVVIGSYHDFKGETTRDDLELMLQQAAELGLRYAKFAIKINDQREYNRLREFSAAHRDEGVKAIVVAMGKELAAEFRKKEPGLMGYAPAGDNVAPGQVPPEELAAAWTLLEQ